jgi:hypothetical protein
MKSLQIENTYRSRLISTRNPFCAHRDFLLKFQVYHLFKLLSQPESKESFPCQWGRAAEITTHCDCSCFACHGVRDGAWPPTRSPAGAARFKQDDM